MSNRDVERAVQAHLLESYNNQAAETALDHLSDFELKSLYRRTWSLVVNLEDIMRDRGVDFSLYT